MEPPYFKSFLDLPPFSLSISTTFGHPDFSFRVNRKSHYIDRFHLFLTAPGRALCILFPDTLLKKKAPFWQIKSRPHTLQREDGPKEELFSAPVFTTGQVGKLVTCLIITRCYVTLSPAWRVVTGSTEKLPASCKLPVVHACHKTPWFPGSWKNSDTVGRRLQLSQGQVCQAFFVPDRQFTIPDF